jgi:hypothetical protein
VCHLKFGSWTYSGLQVDLVNKSTEVDLSNYIKSGEWELRYVTVERNVRYYPCCPDEPYPDVVFYIYIRRRVLYYLFNIILPCIWLSILSLIAFWLPPDSGEKITLGITVLLAFSVFMLLIAENIPATSEMVPLIGVYLTVTMSLTSMSIVLTVFVLQLHHATQFAPSVPRNVYRVFTRSVAVWVGMRNVVRRFERSQASMSSLQAMNSKAVSGQASSALKSDLRECSDALNSLIQNEKQNASPSKTSDKNTHQKRCAPASSCWNRGGSDSNLNEVFSEDHCEKKQRKTTSSIKRPGVGRKESSNKERRVSVTIDEECSEHFLGKFFRNNM